MTRLPDPEIRFQLGLSGWRAIAVGLLILATVIAALALLAVSFFVVILPLMILAPVIYYFLPKLRPKRPMRRDATRQSTAEGQIIDADFRVIEADNAEEDSETTGLDKP